ncbi:3'-5' exonuclease [Microbacterium luticocti]|uniref:3'-5' exonuclease n=1 Tax=Microbacterium luticocti TaxID=451764 RepID=UPI0004138A80|nr:3'-5' exonuclease [Microbacterium luticocti]
MPNIVMTKVKDHATEKALKVKVFNFLAKLAEDDSSVGLHIEKMENAVDSRARTARVDGSWRAVLYRLDSMGHERTYVYAGTWEHDEAIRRARTLRVNLNAVNGAVELIADTMPDQAAPKKWIPTSSMPAAPEPVSFLSSRFGRTFADLTDLLGFDPTTARRLLAAQSESELLDLVGALENAWQQTAGLSLAVGDTIPTIRLELGLDQPSDEEPATQPEDVASGETEDDRILRGLHRPLSKMQFTIVGDDEELRRIIDNGDFGAWRVFLHPEQEKYATGHWNGPFRLSGGAGTGKTVVLLHRARNLVAASPSASIVLTTFTRALGENLQRDLERLDPSIPQARGLGSPGALVRGVDQLAVSIRDHAGEAFGNAGERVLGAIIEAGTSLRSNDAGWDEAIADVDPDLPEAVQTASFLAAEYLQVILPNRISTAEEYFSARRPGRGLALDRKKRAELWKIVDRYRRDARLHRTLSWAELSAVAAAWLEESPAAEALRVDHILVDEGQDLTPTHWQMLRALARPGRDDLFIAEDIHQRIYGQKVTLSRYGIKITGRSRRLTLNYRTTSQNLGYALGVLEGMEYVDAEGAVETVGGYRSARRGPEPLIRGKQTDAAQIDVVAEFIRDWLAEGVDPATIAVLTRTNDRATRLREECTRRNIDLTHLKSAKALSTTPVVLTMHTAKGMEFSRVILFDVSEGVIPNRAVLERAGVAEREDVLLRERSLLYVAASRARDVLVITWAGRPSVLLPRR